MYLTRLGKQINFVVGSEITELLGDLLQLQPHCRPLMLCLKILQLKSEGPGANNPRPFDKLITSFCRGSPQPVHLR